MTTSTTPTQAGQQYTQAYEVHYTTKDLREAISQYHCIIAAHPDSPEAGYSRAQIINIANRVVSKEALVEAHMNMAVAQLGSELATGEAAVVPTQENP